MAPQLLGSPSVASTMICGSIVPSSDCEGSGSLSTIISRATPVGVYVPGGWAGRPLVIAGALFSAGSMIPAGSGQLGIVPNTARPNLTRPCSLGTTPLVGSTSAVRTAPQRDDWPGAGGDTPGMPPPIVVPMPPSATPPSV